MCAFVRMVCVERFFGLVDFSFDYGDGMKYKKITDGDPISLKMGYYRKKKVNDFVVISDADPMRFACCDCGMVHTMVFVHNHLNVIVHMWSERRRTAQLRRHRYGNLQQRAIGRWKMVCNFVKGKASV